MLVSYSCEKSQIIKPNSRKKKHFKFNLFYFLFLSLAAVVNKTYIIRKVLCKGENSVSDMSCENSTG